MILQTLCQYYETLRKLGKVPPPGWSIDVKVSFGLNLSDSGAIQNLLDFRKERDDGEKMHLDPVSINVPAHVMRTSGISANFLCDNSSYMLGVDRKGNAEQNEKCFKVAAALHRKLLNRVDTPAAKAVLAFFDQWDPTQAESCPQLAEHWDDLMGNLNLIFCYNMKPLTEYSEICKVWDRYYEMGDPLAPERQCLVTGEMAPIADIHPRIKGVMGAPSTGASLVSCNVLASCSYGHEKNYNAPVSQYAAFAYSTALNALIADKKYCRFFGDLTLVCWAEHGSECYQDVALATLFSAPGDTIDEDLATFLRNLDQGVWSDLGEVNLNPEERFYFLGFVPNGSRLSIRFFLQDTFGAFLDNIIKHYRDIAIIAPFGDTFTFVPFWQLMAETVNPRLDGKFPSAQLIGDVLHAILTGTPYPATLLAAVQMRIYADQDITRVRAAIIKSYYLRRPTIPFPNEVLTAEGNATSKNIPYTLGRLFSVLEQIQRSSNSGLSVSIRDQYFSIASSMPASIFLRLVSRAQGHLVMNLRKDYKLRAYLKKKMNQCMTVIGEDYPIQLTLPEQGAFQLGYYFETNGR